jgi:hypothetical protein
VCYIVSVFSPSFACSFTTNKHHNKIDIKWALPRCSWESLILSAQVSVDQTGFCRQDCWPGLCSYNCSLCLSCLTTPSSMTFIAFCSQDGVLCAQSMCLSSMECLVNLWSRLTSACLPQDCQLYLQTSVIDSRGMYRSSLHSEGFTHPWFIEFFGIYI